MRAIVNEAFGGPDTLAIKEVPDPDPASGQVVIAVKAFGINRAEIYFREGLWGDVAGISGIECAGVVAADPDGVFAVGQPVLALMGGMGRTIDGSYADFTRLPAGNVVPVETACSWEDLAALPESYATAWTCLHRNLGLAAGRTVVIRGATSALGRAAVNIAVGAGATVLATTRQEARLDSLAALGAEPLVDAADLSKTVRARHEDGIDAVLDIVGNSTILDSLAMVRPDGRVCLAGFLGGGAPIAAFDPLTQMPSGVQLSFFASAFTFGNAEYPLADIPFQDIVDRASDGRYDAKPARVFAFEDIAEAHRLMGSNQANGKIVVRL